MKSLFIIDGHYYIHRAYHAPIGFQMSSPTGEPTTATHMFTVSLLKLIREQEPDALVVAMEGFGRSYRNEIYSEYKANRPYSGDDFLIQRDRIEEILVAMQIPIFRVDGYEADDVIGTITKNAQLRDYEVFICSNDKDMMQLVDTNVYIYDPRIGDYINSDKVVKKTGVNPSQFIDYLALQGDVVDNVPGLPGVGPKTAMKWIQTYGSIKNLLEHNSKLSDKQRDNLLKFKEQLLLSKKLVTIDCNVPLDIDYNDLDMKEFVGDLLREIFVELGFKKLLNQLDMY